MTEQERKAIYQSLCAEGKITRLFMQPWWLDATGLWDVALATRNNQIVGALPFTPGRNLFWKTIGLPALTHHTSMWMEKPHNISEHKWLSREKEIIWMLADALPSHHYFSMVFAENSFDNWLPFHWKGFRQEMRYTFVLDNKPADEINDDLNSSFRKKMRKAESMLTLQHDIDPELFFETCRHTYRRQNIKMPYTAEQFRRADSAIRAHHAGRFIGALNDAGQLIAVASLVWDHDRAYYFLSGDTDQGRESSASLWLCREAIRIAFEEQHVRIFDFCGSMLEPVTEIRRQFGARTVPLMKIFKANSRLLDIAYSLTR